MSKTNLFDEALAAEGVTGKLADLARSIYTQESGGGKNTRTSNAGAVGGMQILPKTFGSVADPGWDITDPSHNARAGIRYLKQMDKLSGGVPELTAAGYYGGPGGLAKAKMGVAVSDPRNPNAPNTLQYGQQVAARLPGAQAPTQMPAAQPVQVPVGGGSPAPAAPVVVAQQEGAPVPVEVAATPVVEQPDPWQAFLRTLAPSRQPGVVTPEDLNFGVQPVPVAQFQLPARPAQTPNFAAFGTWGRRA